ncbi:MAG TPA: hypothetical protein VGM98_11265 [Schlesneria sp.]
MKTRMPKISPIVQNSGFAAALTFIAGLAATQLMAAPGVWNSLSVPIGAPIRNTRLHQQPRPDSAPASITGEAVQLDGTIEPWPARQPRPISAAPKWAGLERSAM